MSKAQENELSQLHATLAVALAEEINKTFEDKNGNLVRSAAMLNVARQFLKDNGIAADAQLPQMQHLLGEMPQFDTLTGDFKLQ